MGSCQGVVDLECSSVVTNGVVGAVCLSERNRHVLEDTQIIGVIAQRETIRRQCRIVVTLAFQRQRLV